MATTGQISDRSEFFYRHSKLFEIFALFEEGIALGKSLLDRFRSDPFCRGNSRSVPTT